MSSSTVAGFGATERLARLCPNGDPPISYAFVTGHALIYDFLSKVCRSGWNGSRFADGGRRSRLRSLRAGAWWTAVKLLQAEAGFRALKCRSETVHVRSLRPRSLNHGSGAPMSHLFTGETAHEIVGGHDGKARPRGSSCGLFLWQDFELFYGRISKILPGAPIRS